MITGSRPMVTRWLRNVRPKKQNNFNGAPSIANTHAQSINTCLELDLYRVWRLCVALIRSVCQSVFSFFFNFKSVAMQNFFIFTTKINAIGMQRNKFIQLCCAGVGGRGGGWGGVEGGGEVGRDGRQEGFEVEGDGRRIGGAEIPSNQHNNINSMQKLIKFYFCSEYLCIKKNAH